MLGKSPWVPNGSGVARVRVRVRVSGFEGVRACGII